MTSRAKAREFELEAAHRRVVEHLETNVVARSLRRRVVVLSAACLLCAAVFAARLVVKDPDALLVNFYIVPIVLVAVEYGALAGLLSGLGALALVFVWVAINGVHLGALGYISRGAALLVAGVVVGRVSDRLREDNVQLRRAQRHLALYAEQLERANHLLARSVERLEAIGEIARAVGDETDLERVLSLILRHAAEIVSARTFAVYLVDGDELVAVETDALPADLRRRVPVSSAYPAGALPVGAARRAPAHDPPAELSELMAGARSGIVVPLAFRGEFLGVLAGIDNTDGPGFEPEDEELLMSVAASAAAAVTTVRSVAAARLRLSLEAADQARARWARELHDETLQGLTGARMVLSAGLVRDELGALRRAAEATDAHLGEETRKLRELIAELRPAALDDLGLGPAIDSLVKRQAALGGFGVTVEVALGEGRRLSRETENAIYRIVQEALNNAVKHAHARSVELRVRERGDRVEIAVSDDGCGFEPALARHGFGLTGMRERAMLAGGQLSVASGDGGPTCVTAVLPLASTVSGDGARQQVLSG